VALMRRTRSNEAVGFHPGPLVRPPIGRAAAGQPRLGDLLLTDGLITPTDVAGALTRQQVSGRRLGSILIDQGIIDDRVLANALSRQFGIPMADLRRDNPEPDATGLISESAARSLMVVPLRLLDGHLDVVISDPLDVRVDELLAVLPVREVTLHLAPLEELRSAINRAYRALAEVGEHVAAFEGAEIARLPADGDPRVTIDDDAPIIQVVNKVVTQAMRDRASDIHIEPIDEHVRVRYRIDGALNQVLTLPASMAPALVSRIKIMANMNIVERRRPQDGQFQMTIDGRDVDVRVSTTATIWGEKAVLRLLDKSRSLYTLGELGMPAEIHHRYSQLVRSPFGMMIVSGPTGSGKTTTLYATLTEIHRDEVNVMTIEDPVEYVFRSVNQIQINEQADVTFASGLKSILRQDPDVILVGEVRDVETARIAVQSALTGHLVLSSIHATDAASALYRLLDMGIEPFLVASAIVGVVGQRLVRRICQSCIAPYQPTPSEMLFYQQLGGIPKPRWIHGEGCNVCAGTGYRDRIGVYEVLAVTDEVRQMLITGSSPRELRDLVIRQGMQPLRTQALRLVSDDVTTIAEIIRTVYVV